ncbi:hypothetical protein [Candidatus Magnetobacterium casense]|uniref:Uncharacterized protein n=1 Tax=Candidatus Magnetobacterium casense TaxID=1455061 RepID=A0ABS6RUU6_9BACT|nr:hypothetical protein [Candidatus Magnetobacterium casensis]MBV6340120.1 hypothetical protein [Candidatus Magnetobacterium casensis]
MNNNIMGSPKKSNKILDFCDNKESCEKCENHEECSDMKKSMDKSVESLKGGKRPDHVRKAMHNVDKLLSHEEISRHLFSSAGGMLATMQYAKRMGENITIGTMIAMLAAILCKLEDENIIVIKHKKRK